ncbi:hypothetical protein H5T51_01500, partial [Candidatus Bathyarchaeota archaeon]|nr:hypothetical protein [Candidatus Bathyarchaeota archaeon]
HRSPLLSILYYIDQKLNITEGTYNPVNPNLFWDIIAKELQFSLGEMLSEYHMGRRSYTLLPNGKGDIDIVILNQRGKKPIIGYEVKLGEIETTEAKKAVETIHSYGIPNAGLISLSSKPPMIPGAHECLGPKELASIAEKIGKLNIQS